MSYSWLAVLILCHEAFNDWKMGILARADYVHRQWSFAWTCCLIIECKCEFRCTLGGSVAAFFAVLGFWPRRYNWFHQSWSLIIDSHIRSSNFIGDADLCYVICLQSAKKGIPVWKLAIVCVRVVLCLTCICILKFLHPIAFLHLKEICCWGGQSESARFASCMPKFSAVPS